MVTLEILRNRVLHILCSPAAGKVKFKMDGVEITGGALLVVALSLRLNSLITLGTIGLRVGNVSPGAGASYSTHDNVLDVPDAKFGTTDYQRSSIVHESIHAYLVLQKSATKARTDEALAYVAGALYLIHDTTAAGATPKTPSFAKTDPVFKKAHEIALSLYTGPSTEVSSADASEMKKAITMDPVYEWAILDPDMKYNNDGL